MSDKIERYVDNAMFEAEPMQSRVPKVTLLQMSPDPLGAIAAACRMYEGKPTYNLMEITDDERRHYWTQVQQTHLQAPLEFVHLHFFLEGVDRAFTHQLVRQRTAVYAQESMRFAVKAGMAKEASVPPSLSTAPKSLTEFWHETLQTIEEAYNYLVANGIPAEDARGILPHCTTTRIHYATNLRNLVDHAGNRLCTQAQFVWRLVFAGIVDAIRGYTLGISTNSPLLATMRSARGWQFEMIANSNLFRPVCYQKNACPFNADFDRGCTIRGRVEQNGRIPRTSEEWGEDWGHDARVSPPVPVVRAIREEEWLLDPQAAFVRGEHSGQGS